MIISHKHKFIFIKNNKTAGTSIEISLSKICGKNDIITPISPDDEKVRKSDGIGAQNYYIPFKKYTFLDWILFFVKMKRKTFYNHIPASAVKKIVSKDIWDNYYKFCFERNPFDKIISHYYYRLRKEDLSLSSYIENGYMRGIKGYDMYTDGGNVIVDKIYKYEQIEEALKDLSEKIGQPVELSKYKAKGNFRKDRRHYRELFNEKQRNIIETLFAREMKLLNYKF